MRPLQAITESNRPDLDDDDLETMMDHIEKTLKHHDENSPDGPDGTRWAVLDHDKGRHNAARPLAIIVHPGDMCNALYGWDDVERESNRWGKQNVEGLGQEMGSLRREGADFVIIHRGSCSQFSNGGSLNTDEFMEELAYAWHHGTVLFTDDLDRAIHWMVENLHIEKRPKIFLGGAYSDFDHGCLTKIGRAVERVAGTDKIDVSDYTPADNMYDYHDYESDEDVEYEDDESSDDEDKFVNTNKPVQWRPGNRHVEQFDWGMWKKSPPGEPHPHDVNRKGWVVTWSNPKTGDVQTWRVQASHAANEHEANQQVRSMDSWKKAYRAGYTDPTGIESEH